MKQTTLFKRKLVNFTDVEWTLLRLECQKRGCRLMFLIHKIIHEWFVEQAKKENV